MKKALNLDLFSDSDWKLMDQVQNDIDTNSKKTFAIYFFAKDGTHSFCRRYNREVNFKRDVEDLKLCEKCGMRFWNYRAAQICVFAPGSEYYTIDNPAEAASIDTFPDKGKAEKGIVEFESKNW